ncbi:Bro-N domain-containing protein [Alicyclobacillus tolerans]|uniref:BRO-N domain-containing protein n=1 Tax=Alicyclobacillus tolerans TaxID=90970 RepID=UPI001F42EFF3|nr:Bro-N domain-containing protein [Alicyclobacillus tolerans]MCF8568009.1 Bro-N domain-containing protein [Alicyclobacillus tolerans]
MNELEKVIPFSDENAGWNVRVVMFDGEPWFVAVDVCKALNIANPTRTLSRLDDDEKGLHSVKTFGGVQDLNTVNEAGLYSLILTSRKPEAKSFKRWITHQVLPSIRKTGEYSMKNQTPQTYIEALEALVQAEKEKLRLQQNVQEMQPKAEAYNVKLQNPSERVETASLSSCGTGKF